VTVFIPVRVLDNRATSNRSSFRHKSRYRLHNGEKADNPGNKIDNGSRPPRIRTHRTHRQPAHLLHLIYKRATNGLSIPRLLYRSPPSPITISPGALPICPDKQIKYLLLPVGKHDHDAIPVLPNTQPRPQPSRTGTPPGPRGAGRILCLWRCGGWLGVGLFSLCWQLGATPLDDD
jgi:hypothetical protein